MDNLYFYAEDLENGIYSTKRISLNEMSESVVDKVSILCRHFTNKDIFVNTETGISAPTLEEVVKDIEKPHHVYEMSKSAKHIYGVKPMYDAKQEKLCFAYFSMDIENIFKTPYIAKWSEICRVYFNTERNKRLIWRNNYHVYSPKPPYYGWALAGKNEFVEVPLNWKNLNGLDHPDKVYLIDNGDKIYDSEGSKWSWDWTDALKPFQDKIGKILPIAGNRMVAMDNIFSLVSYFSYAQPTGGTSKAQDGLDELVSIELPDVEIPDNLPVAEIDFECKGKNVNKSSSNIQRFAVIQKVPDIDEPMCVLRSFFYSKQLDCLREGGRIYIGKQKIISSKTMEDGKFMYQPLQNIASHWNLTIPDFNEDITKGTKLEYYAQIIKEIDKEDRGTVIWAFLKWPIMESMYKIDLFKPFMQDVFKLSKSKSPIDVIKECFGDIDIKNGTTPYKLLGINKKQAELIMPVLHKYMPKVNKYGCFINRGISYYLKAALKQSNMHTGISGYNIDTKSIIPCYDISDIDTETVEMFLDALEGCIDSEKKEKFLELPLNVDADILDIGCQINLAFYRMTLCMISTKEAYGIHAVKKVLEPLTEYFNEQVSYKREAISANLNFIETLGNINVIYRDYIEMVTIMDRTTRFKPYFDTPQQLADMHDLVLELFINKKFEINMERWNSRKEKSDWEKWEFETEEFSVIAPQIPEDLTNEGISLHHCVGGYIDRVMSGITNIMFIRRNDNLEKPFYTVEITNDNVIQQVHGVCNCIAAATPGVTEFVKKWAKAKNLMIENYNKVR